MTDITAIETLTQRNNNMTRNYKVIVGDAGIVYSGGSEFEACKKYDECVFTSNKANRKTSGEDVTLYLMDGRVLRKHVGYNNSNK